VSYRNVGNVQIAQGDLAGALKSYRDSLGIRKRLAGQDPGTARWQSDLSVSYNKVGDVQSVQGDLAGAFKSYRDSLGIFEKLAKQDPDNAGWQRNLSVSYNKVGDVQSAQGDLAGALKSYRDSLGILEKLAKQDPGNAIWQSDSALAYWKTGSAWALVEPKSRNEARAMVERGRDILRQLKERTGLTAIQQGLLDAIEVALRRVQREEMTMGRKATSTLFQGFLSRMRRLIVGKAAGKEGEPQP
jgi:tetratricopeptide (TPR) repeat protein